MFKLLALVTIVAVAAAVVSAEAAEIGVNADAGRATATATVTAAIAEADAAPGSGTLASPARRRRACDRNYRGRCLRPNASDYDCAGGGGNGPYYVRGPFRVVGTDHHRLDADGDGIACES